MEVGFSALGVEILRGATTKDTPPQKKSLV